MREALAIEEQVKQLKEYLGCPCTWIPSMTEDRPILEAYREARRRGEREGFCPLLISAGDSQWFLNFAAYRRQSREGCCPLRCPTGGGWSVSAFKAGGRKSPQRTHP